MLASPPSSTRPRFPNRVLKRHGRVELDEATLLDVSAATIDRLLGGVRQVAANGDRRPAGFGWTVRRSVPIRTFNDWGNPARGWVEIDFVTHSGTMVSGAFVQIMVLTDVATGGRSASHSWCARPTWSCMRLARHVNCFRFCCRRWISTTTACS